MDMGMDMSHGGHGGMSIGTNLFQTTNMSMARSYWYIVLGTLGGFALVRILNHYQTLKRYVGPHVLLSCVVGGPSGMLTGPLID